MSYVIYALIVVVIIISDAVIGCRIITCYQICISASVALH